MPNILEVFIKRNKQIIIFIFGMPCSNKNEVAKEINNTFNLHLINQNSYLLKKTIEKTIDNETYKIYEHEDNYDWEKFNEDVNNNKSKGVIIYGNFIYPNKIDFTIDFTLFIGMNKTLCKECLVNKKMLPDNDKTDLYLKNILFPTYDELKKVLKINKFYNIKSDTKLDDINDNVYDDLIELIKKNLDGDNYKKINDR